ncbi:hypothetical protein GCM10010123_36230 [Pilimelia anulata]|uniref:Uncharacterized protein n=1 Tax=Pilimelia anulata TaxID=53371 RepID=A0A8J3FF31_9ACTN|nr:hypothetical protein [Pilimelia anulata]GGK03036.1 hypothetical protein GCM10010123_36230 [Pilimelia anulata]
MRYHDIDRGTVLPPAPPGYRYLDFLGGSRDLRCYLVPADTPRCVFLRRHRDVLDEALQPVYDHRGVCVRQDASHALPGFYIVGLDRQYPALDLMDEDTHLRVALVLRAVRAGMRAALGIDYVHVYQEEKPDPSCNVHYWLMPIVEPCGDATTVARLDVGRYLAAFRFPDHRATIRQYNRRLRRHLAAADLAGRDDALAARLAAPAGPGPAAARAPARWTCTWTPTRDLRAAG